MRILKYLNNTSDYGLVIRRPRNMDDIRLLAFSDASHANDPVTGRSISGIFITVSGCILDWTSKHQPYVSLHSGEAETISASTAVTHIQYWQQLLEPILGFVPSTELMVDSTTAHSTLSTPIHTSQMKHIRTKLLYVRELHRAKLFAVRWLTGTNHPSDMLTKALSPEQLVHLRRALRAWGGASLMESSANMRKNRDRAIEQLRERNATRERTSTGTQELKKDDDARPAKRARTTSSSTNDPLVMLTLHPQPGNLHQLHPWCTCRN